MEICVFDVIIHHVLSEKGVVWCSSMHPTSNQVWVHYPSSFSSEVRWCRYSHSTLKSQTQWTVCILFLSELQILKLYYWRDHQHYQCGYQNLVRLQCLLMHLIYNSNHWKCVFLIKWCWNVVFYHPTPLCPINGGLNLSWSNLNRV